MQTVRSNPLSHTIVAVFAPVRKGEIDVPLPENVRDVLLTLFGDAVHTLVKFGPAGLEAVLPGVPVPRRAEFGPLRISVATGTIEETASAFSKLYALWASAKSPFAPFAYGLNHEFEFHIGGVSRVERWIADRFLQKALNFPKGWEVVAGKISFAMKHQEGFKVLIALEERAQKSDYFFCNANNHHEISKIDEFQPSNAQEWVKRLKLSYESTEKLVLECVKKRGRKTGGA